ncbi:MAG: PucR family transcriptional regulator [Streptosporangiales bacterium]|nr:PucR family transcriptional regulator [Streptosporangiales bacterium]
MRTFAEVLHFPGLAGVTVLAGEPARVHPAAVVVVERLADLRALAAGSVAVLSDLATADAWGYRLDVAVREVAAVRVAGLVLTGARAPAQVPATVAGMAECAGVVVLRADQEPLADLVVSLSAALVGGPGEQLRVVASAHAALADLERRGAEDPLAEATRVASDALGRPVAQQYDAGTQTAEQVAETVECEGEPTRWLVVDAGAADQVTARLVLTLAAGAAGAAGRLLAANRRREDVPVRSRSAVLGEVLVASGERLSRLLDTARAVGMPIDGWHEVVRIEFDDGRGRALDEVSRFALLESATRLALQVARASGRTWNVAQADGAVVLVRTSRYDPGTAGTRDTAAVADRVLARLADLAPGGAQWCGIGTAHDGATGLLASAAEARAAVSKGRALGRAGQSVVYDLTGLGRMLVDWYASDSARQAVHDLLRPLEALDRHRAEAAIETLHVYLDERGSTSRAGERLHLHRNAVTYRIKSITDLLGVDLDDADQRLALQLACRARLFR